MGIEVVLQDERCNPIGSAVHDPQGVLAKCLPELDDESYCCVRFIDPYGDTIFNPLQAAAMIEEWDRLKAAFVDKNAEPFWAEVRDMIVRCSEKRHRYLRFVGD